MHSSDVVRPRLANLLAVAQLYITIEQLEAVDSHLDAIPGSDGLAYEALREVLLGPGGAALCFPVAEREGGARRGRGSSVLEERFKKDRR